jgi:hypothetical protein
MDPEHYHIALMVGVNGLAELNQEMAYNILFSD